MLKNNQKADIIISCGSYSWGGLEMVAMENSLKLQEYGYSVTLMCTKNSILESKALKKGLDTLPVFSTDSKIPSSVLKLKKYLRTINPDIIHSHNSHDLWILTPAIKASGCKAKLFLTKHVASGIKKTDYLHKMLYKKVNAVFAISGYIKTSVINTTPVIEEKIYVLPNGVDLSRFDRTKYNRSEVCSNFHIPRGLFVIGMVGRITPGKGHAEFIEAAKILNEKYPGRLFFLIVGSSDEKEQDFGNKIKALAEGTGNIIFTGQIDEPQKLMSAMDILAFPSHDESFGRVIIEAMAMALPVAASGYAGVPDIITDGLTGLLFEPKDPSSLAIALEKLIIDENLRKMLAVNGRELVEKKFAENIIIEKLIEYYKKL
jgi:glycosyltransferase involved in cell wall biosynthesis